MHGVWIKKFQAWQLAFTLHGTFLGETMASQNTEKIIEFLLNLHNIDDFGANLFINNDNQVHEKTAPAQIVHESILTPTTTVSVETLSSPERILNRLEILIYLSVLTV